MDQVSRNKKKKDDGLIDIEDAVKEMSPESLECRDFQHNWRSWMAKRVQWGFERVLRCNNCAAERHEELNRQGGLINRHYVYPEGYTVKGLGRLSGDRKDALRLVSLIRAVDGEKSLKAAQKKPRKAQKEAS